MDYQKVGQESYGMAGLYGHKVWVTAVRELSDPEIEKATNYFRKTLKREKVELGKRSFKPNEITLFFYWGRFPGKNGNWIADKVVTQKL